MVRLLASKECEFKVDKLFRRTNVQQQKFENKILNSLQIQGFISSQLFGRMEN